MFLKKLQKLIIKIYYSYVKNYAIQSYSQEGEDRILMRLFEGKKTGFYVDVGAHHPKRFSNTHAFYKMGWRGINIEPSSGSIQLFKKLRSDDINIAAAISDHNESVKYFIFNESALNTFDEKLAKERQSPEYNIIQTKILNTQTLKCVLDNHLPKNQNIDFLNIDTEGYDLKVLNSNDWSIYNPSIILCESIDEKAEESAIYKYLISKNYQLSAKTVNTLIFKKS